MTRGAPYLPPLAPSSRPFHCNDSRTAERGRQSVTLLVKVPNVLV